MQARTVFLDSGFARLRSRPGMTLGVKEAAMTTWGTDPAMTV